MAWSQQQLWKKMCHRLPNSRDVLNCFFNRSSKHLYGFSGFHNNQTCSMIYRTNTRIFPVTIFWCSLLHFPNLTLLAVLWDNKGVYTFITNSHCHNTICRWMATVLPGAINFSMCWRDSFLVYWRRKSNLIILLFATISYALQSCSSVVLYVGSEIEFIFMHRENDFIASNPLPIF